VAKAHKSIRCNVVLRFFGTGALLGMRLRLLFSIQLSDRRLGLHLTRLQPGNPLSKFLERIAAAELVVRISNKFTGADVPMPTLAPVT